MKIEMKQGNILPLLTMRKLETLAKNTNTKVRTIEKKYTLFSCTHTFIVLGAEKDKQAFKDVLNELSNVVEFREMETCTTVQNLLTAV